MSFNLAQVNVALALAPMDSPKMAGFVRALDHVNRAAEAAEGFVWRLQDESGDATAIPFLNDERWVVNLSVWRSLEELERLVHERPHQPIMGLRNRWFEPLDKPATACWWVPEGHLPDVAEAERMITRLWEEGPSAEVFGFGGGVPPAAPTT